MSDKEEQYKPGISLWCAEHDHMKRSCPWCENEKLESTIQQLTEERDKLRECLKYVRQELRETGLLPMVKFEVSSILSQLEGESK